jgi:LPXTG-motif cell wall-anchored protein
MQDSNPKTDIVCGDSAVNWSYYRKVPASITEAATNARMHSHPSLTTLADTSPAFSVPQPNAPTNKKSGTSKAWIAGAVIGPLLGLALIGAIIFFVLRRRKNKKNIAPQQGGTAMMAVNTAQAPPGVGGYTDAKPQFTQQQQPTYTAPQQQQPTYIAPQQQPAYNNPYANQGAYAAQQGYNDAPLSPAPQYNTGAGPYNPPVRIRGCAYGRCCGTWRAKWWYFSGTSSWTCTPGWTSSSCWTFISGCGTWGRGSTGCWAV